MRDREVAGKRRFADSRFGRAAQRVAVERDTRAVRVKSLELIRLRAQVNHHEPGFYRGTAVSEGNNLPPLR